MSNTYPNHFQELCDRLSFNTVVFFQDSGEVLAFRMLSSDKTPQFCSLNFQYDLIGNDHSKVFYGLDLSLDNQTLICSGSVNIIDIGSRKIVIVFFDSLIKHFHDNQLPKILWKSKEGVYLGHSEYVPFESDVPHSMVGMKDVDIYSGIKLESILESDSQVFTQGVVYWDIFSRVQVDSYTTMVKYHKFPYYSEQSELIGEVIVYTPVIETSSFLSEYNNEISREDIDAMVKETLSNSNLILLIYNRRSRKLEYTTSNFHFLGYDVEDFTSGNKQLIELMHPADTKQYLEKLESQLYLKRKAFSYRCRLISSEKKTIETNLKVIPIIPHKFKVEHIAIIVEFMENQSEEAKRCELFMQLANKGKIIYAFRNVQNPLNIDFITENITQFGYSQQEITDNEIRFEDIIHHDDIDNVKYQFDQLVHGLVSQVRIEYRIVARRKDIYWIEEKCYFLKKGNQTYLESIIRNITTSRLAIDDLNRLNQSNEDSKEKQRLPQDLDVLLDHILYSIDLGKQILDFTRQHSLHVAIYNNSDEFLSPFASSEKSLKVLTEVIYPEGLKNVKSIQFPDFDNVYCKSIPLKNQSFRIGTLLMYGIIQEVEGIKSYQDSDNLFEKIPFEVLPELYSLSNEFAENISQLIHLTSLTINQTQFSSRFHGDLISMRKKHAVLLEMLDLANTFDNIENFFDTVYPKIAETFQLSRGAFFKRDDQDKNLYHCVKEWASQFDVRRIDEYSNVQKKDTFFQDWDFNEQNSYVIHYDDDSKESLFPRNHAQAIVGVGISIKGQLHGVLTFADNHSQRIWSDDDIMLFEDFGYIFSYVAEKKSSQDRIIVNQNQLIKTLNSLPNAVAIFSKEDEKLIQTNSSFKKTFQGKNGKIDESTITSLKDMMRNGKDQKEPKEFYLENKDLWFKIEKNEVDFGFETNTCMLILTDITSSKKNAEMISNLAFKDALSDLPNRVKFELDISKTYESKGSSISSAFIGIMNIDNFKMINNTYSYAFGDSLIKELARQLSQIEELKDSVYRFGGDEFSFLVRGNFGEQVYEVANKIMSLFEAPFFVEGYESYMTASLGISFFSDTEKNTHTLVRNANISLMEAKASGKNKFVLYDSSLRKYEEDTLHMESALKVAVEAGCQEFEVYYQPIIDSKTSRIVGAEALVRWFSKEIGYVPPVKFIPIAESTGLIIPLGKHILNHACKEAKKWLDHGHDIYVSVNFSVIQMLQSDLVSTILSTIHTYRIPPKNLMMEITESLAIKDVSKIVDILNSVRQIGVKVAMDDFGTGYSSLSHLRKLPLDNVKIDRSFAFNLEYDPYYFSFIETITTFCHLNNTKVCVEGVENENQKNILAKTSVDTLQGYLFARPESASDFWRKLVKQT